jgi:hypothetical protein
MDKLDLLEEPNIVHPLNQDNSFPSAKLGNKQTELLVQEYEMKMWIYELGKSIDDIMNTYLKRAIDHNATSKDDNQLYSQ